MRQSLVRVPSLLRKKLTAGRLSGRSELTSSRSWEVTVTAFTLAPCTVLKRACSTSSWVKASSWPANDRGR